jgi:hypothetical protein
MSSQTQQQIQELRKAIENVYLSVRAAMTLIDEQTDGPFEMRIALKDIKKNVDRADEEAEVVITYLEGTVFSLARTLNERDKGCKGA